MAVKSWLLMNKWCYSLGLTSHWLDSTLQNWDQVHDYRPECFEIISLLFWKFKGSEFSNVSCLLALLGLFIFSQILERGSMCSISSSLSSRELMYSAERLHISHGAAENSLWVVKTNITLVHLKSLIRNPGFGFCAVELFCAARSTCLTEHPPTPSAPPKKGSSTMWTRSVADMETDVSKNTIGNV